MLWILFLIFSYFTLVKKKTRLSFWSTIKNYDDVMYALDFTHTNSLQAPTLFKYSFFVTKNRLSISLFYAYIIK